MRLPDIKGIVNLGRTVVMANRPEILLGAAIASTIAAVALAAKGGYDSGKFIAHVESENLANGYPPPTKAEIVQLTWQNYVPAALCTATALSSTGGLHWIHVREKKALVATGLAAVEEARTELKAYIDDLKDSVEENTTPKTLDKIKDGVVEKQIDRFERHGDGVLEPHYILRDRHSGNHFYGNRNDVIDAVTELNRSIVDNGDANLNTFYNHAGWNDTDHGNDVGWSGGQRVTVRWSLATREDGTPVAQFQLEPAPKADYEQSHR